MRSNGTCFDGQLLRPVRWLIACHPILLVMILSSCAAGGDTSILKPPNGSVVAIVVFEDLQCVGCASAAPALEEIARTENVPLIRHDFPSPAHDWARKAAVFARFFDSRSKKIGDEFRRHIFAEQLQITSENLPAVAAQFAARHNIGLPFAIDPDGRFVQQVQQDIKLGLRVGVQHTPVVFVVTTAANPSVVEVDDAEHLSRVVIEMKAKASKGR